jgi:hypothetical protein
MTGMALLIADNSGIYIPRAFAEEFDPESWSIPADDNDWNLLLEGPDAEFYWEAWHSILIRAVLKDELGNVWTLHQDGDLWAVCVDLMTDEEYEGYFGESRVTVEDEITD